MMGGLLLPACGGDDGEVRGPLACGSEEDRGRDGSVDVRWTFTYDAADRLTLEDGEYADGGSAEQFVWEYGNGENVTLFEWYIDESLAWHEAYTYDGDNYLLSEEYDVDGNGLDERTTHEYEAGKRTVSETDDEDASGEPGPDGTTDLRRTYTYEGELLAVVALDTDVDGTPDHTYTYVYEGELLTALEGRDAGFEGIFYLETYEYDGRDRLVRRVTDIDNDGEFDWRSTWTYDEEDRVITALTEYSARFGADEIEAHWTYGEDGLLLEFDLTGTDRDYTTTYLYECSEDGAASSRVLAATARLRAFHRARLRQATERVAAPRLMIGYPLRLSPAPTRRAAAL